MVRISLDVQQDTIERLESLSEFYDKSVKEIISEILEVISHESRSLPNLNKEYRIPISLTGVLSGSVKSSSGGIICKLSSGEAFW